jgi:hypothetical protein
MNLAGSKQRKEAKETGRRVRQRSAVEDEREDQDAEMEDLRKNMEMMTATVGTGVHAQTILSARSMSTTTNSRDIANLQAAVTKNYEIPPDKLMEAFDRVWRKIGKRKYDPPPPKSVNKDLRKWAIDNKER